MTAFWLALLRAFCKLPLPATRAFGAALGTLLYAIARQRRRVARINLRACFPEMPERSRRRLARAHFRAFTQSVIDRGWVWWGRKEVIEKRVQWVDFHHFQEGLDRGPVLILAPHFVGLDAGGVRISMILHAMTMYSRQKNRTLDAAMLDARQRWNKSVLLSRQDGMRPVVRGMRRGLSFYYLPDMDFGARDAAFVSFFGVLAATITAPARLARIGKASVVPCVTRMTKTGYEVRFYSAWEHFPDADDDSPATLARAARRMNAFIEERVAEMPAQYLWTHKRFKTRPPGDAPMYKR